jgi:uncharacterized protein
MRITTTILTLLLALSSIEASAEPSTAKAKAAEKLMETLGIASLYQNSFDAMVPGFLQEAQKYEFNEEQTKEFIAVYREWYNNDIDFDAIVSSARDVYAEEFTIEEMEGMIEFYESPVGQKALKKLPVIMQRGMQIGREESEKSRAALQERFQEFWDKINAEN